MREIYLGLKFAFSYFTNLPINFKEDDDLSQKSVMNYLLFFLPFVGLVLGLIVVVLYSFLDSLSWFGAIICAISYMFLYGFIHTEAIIDVADAIYAKHSGKDAYTVIKDPTIGAMGLLYAVGFVLLKISAIVYLFLNHFLLEFVFVLIASRVMLLFLIKTHTFKSSFVSLLKESLNERSFYLVIALSLLIGGILIGLKSFMLLFFAFFFGYIIFKILNKSLGFLNGDALGTTLESVEIILFIIIALNFL